MSVVAATSQVTPEELLGLPDQKAFELIDGELVERPVSVLSSWVGLNLACLIRNHVEFHQLGWVFGSNNGFQCFPDRPRTVRRPDVSFLKAGRMSWDEVSDGWLHVVPDLIVEVISPNDKAYEVEVKVEFFLNAGVPLVWVVNPKTRTVRVIRGDGTTALLREANELSGEDIIPGFGCPVASIFPPKAPAAPAPSEAPGSSGA
jgi:Uma2 family endonuclease